MHSSSNSFRIFIIVILFSWVIPFLLYPIFVEVLHRDPAILLAPYLSYNNIIISFMCGALWSNVKSAQNLPMRLKVTFVSSSILLTAISWLSFNLLEAKDQLKVYALLFVLFLAADFILHKHDHLPRWYYLARVAVTGMVLVLLMYSLKYV